MIKDMILGTLYPKIKLIKLPLSLNELARVDGYRIDSKLVVENGAQEISGHYRSSSISVFVEEGFVQGIRYDLQLQIEILKRVLKRSALKYLNLTPQVLLDVDLSYVANIGDNVATISGYIGSIGLWTKEYDAKTRLKR